jgi:hypothetical protein
MAGGRRTSESGRGEFRKMIRLGYKRRSFVLLLALVFAVCVAHPALAEDEPYRGTGKGGRKMYDLTVLRPLGIVQVGTGMAAFVTFYPISLAMGGSDFVEDVCITMPVDRTFEKPLGDF